MNKKFIFSLLLISFVLISGFSQDVLMGPSILKAMTGEESYEHDLCVLLDSYIDLQEFEAESKSLGLIGKQSVPRLIKELKSHAKSSQADLLSFLEKEGINSDNIESYWIENVIFFKASEALISKLSERNDISEIHTNGEITWDEPVEEEALEDASHKISREQGLVAINAPFMWNKGYTGYGRKIFIIDSGVDPNHKALQRQNAWNNHSIQEVWIPTGDENFTYDCDVHGTHVLGIACGLDRDMQDTIGAAFNAEWISGNPIGCFRGVRRNSIYGMFQWSLNPDGDLNTTEDVPDVINNSWADYSLGYCSALYRDMLLTLESADIAAIFSAGNEGPNDQTLSPPHNLEMSSVNPLTVGAVNSSQIIADFSSRGPAKCPTNGRISIKPEVCAPGVAIRSSVPGNNYTEYQGTSMAAPHVTGAYTLLKEAFPSLSAKDLKEALYYSAIDLGVTGNDNYYGNGFIDLEGAYNYLTSRGNTPFDPSFEIDLELWDVSYDSEGCKDDYEARVLIYNGGKRLISSAEIKMRIKNLPFLSTTNWTGNLLPGEKEWVSLESIDAIVGDFTIVFTIEDVNGNGKDDRTINDQLKRLLKLKNSENFEIKVQDEFGDLCVGSRVALSVEGAFADEYNWYEELPLNNVSGQGKTYTPELKEGKNSFFVLPKYKSKSVGPELLEGDELEYSYQNGRLVFELTEPILLKSMDIHSYSSGSVSFRFIKEVYDTIFTANNYPAFGRPQTLPINRTLPVGEYVLEVIDNPGLGYQLEGVNYPYEIEDVISITGGIPEFQGVAPYFYFYNWKLDYSHPCGPKEVQITTNGNGGVPFSDFDLSTSTLELPDNDEILTTNNSTSAQDYLWTFGDGSESNDVEPSHSYNSPGLYSVTLIAKSSNNCTDAHAIDVLVSGMSTNNLENEDIDKVSIYPNPINENLFIDASTLGRMNIEVKIIDNLGRIVYQSENINATEILELNTSLFDSGLYYISIYTEKNILSYKLVKQ